MDYSSADALFLTSGFLFRPRKKLRILANIFALDVGKQNKINYELEETTEAIFEGLKGLRGK